MIRILKFGAWGCLGVAVFLMGAMVVAMPDNIDRFGWGFLVMILPLGLLWFFLLSTPMLIFVVPDRLAKNGICLTIIGLVELLVFGGVIYSAIYSTFG